jgi:hypothetical protein
MNPAALQPQRRIHRSPVVPAALAEDLDACPDNVRTSHPFSHLEPGPEGLLFAAACVLGSGLIYGIVLITQSLA